MTTKNITIEAPTTSALIMEAFNVALRPYLATAMTERERKDTDGNVIETRCPAKDRLEFSLRGECNLFWMQLYGNTEDPRNPQQYSAMHNIMWAEERLAPLQAKLERGSLNGREEEMHATYMAAKDENIRLYRYYLNRFSAARKMYESNMEQPYEYRPYDKKNPQVKHTNGLQQAIGAVSEDDPFFQAVNSQRGTATQQAAAETAEQNMQEAV